MAFLEKLLNKDTLRNLEDVLTNLEYLADAEAQISVFYKLCGVAMTKEQNLWNSLSDQELRHADTVKKMIAMIKQKPKLYKPGISFSTMTIRLFDVEMQRLVEQMNAGRISAEKLFAIALEIEDSAVEMSYSRMVKTEDQKFLSLARQIDNESAEHKSAISARSQVLRT